MADTQETKAQKSALEIRKKVLADPNTAKIAEKLGVPLEEYVEGVVHFAMNPEELPEYVVVTDETLQEKFGLGPTPKVAEILRTFDEQVKYATLLDQTDYTAPTAGPVAIPGPTAQPSPDAGDATLAEELRKELRTKKGGNV